MFGKKKKKERFDDTEYEEVTDEEGTEISDDDDDDLMDGLGGITEEDDSRKKSIRAKYTRIQALFRKHMIYVRVTSLLVLSTVLVISLAGGIVSGTNTQGAKAKQVTPFGTQLQFSKTAATVTVGRIVRSGTTLLIPVYSDGAQPIDRDATKQTGDSSTWIGATTSIKLPSYKQADNASFVPLSATKYRMYISALKGKVNPATQAKYVKFGATGLGAIIVSNVDPENTIRVLLENKKATQNPGVTAPGLKVDGKPINSNRDLVMINARLGQAKKSDSEFTINSSAVKLLNVTYGDDYMSLWKSDQSSAEKYLKSDSAKLAELQANKSSLDAANSKDTTGRGQSGSEVAINAQQSLVESDNKNLETLKQEKSDLDSYIETVSGQMTVSSEFKLAK